MHTTPKLLPIKKPCSWREMNLVPMHVWSGKGLSKIPKAFPLHLNASSWVQSGFPNLSTNSAGCHCNYHRNLVIYIQMCFSHRKQVLQAMGIVSRVRRMLIASHLTIKKVCCRAHFLTIYVWMCWYFFSCCFSLVLFFFCFVVGYRWEPSNFLFIFVFYLQWYGMPLVILHQMNHWSMV